MGNVLQRETFMFYTLLSLIKHEEALLFNMKSLMKYRISETIAGLSESEVGMILLISGHVLLLCLKLDHRTREDIRED